MTSIGNVVRIGVLRTPWGRRPQHRLRAKGFAAEPEDDTNPADAFTHRLSEFAKKQGHVNDRRHLVMGGATGESGWRELDKKVNSYPSQRMFTAIGSGGTDFVDSMVSVVEQHLGPVHLECVSQRSSSNGKYLSVTVGPVWVQNADQVVEVYAMMKGDMRVKWCM